MARHPGQGTGLFRGFGVAWSSRATVESPARGEEIMPKIKHIAISTQDVDKTAKFYIDVFGMKEVGKVDSPGARGYYLTDGDLNLAILNFKQDAVAGVERGKSWSGIHHIGFEVDSLEEITEKLAAAGSEPRHDVNRALGVGHGPRQRSEERRVGKEGKAGWGRGHEKKEEREGSGNIED